MEYEIYKNLANSQALSGYADSYGLSLGIPQIMFDKENKNSGDSPILNNLDEMIQSAPQGEIFLADGKSISFGELNLNDLVRYPTFYSKDRIAIRKSLTKITDQQNTQIKNFISSTTIQEAITGLNGKE